MSKKISKPALQPQKQQPVAAKVEPKAQPIVQQQLPNSNSKLHQWIGALLTVVVAFVTFYNSHTNSFVLDDHGIIKSNKITKQGVTAENLKKIFTTSHRKGDVSDLEHSLYRPMAKAIFAWEWDKSNGEASFFHWGNILFYVLTCLVLYLVLYYAFKQNWLLALSVSLLYTTHPIHSEVVANIKSLDEILGMLGTLLAMRCAQLYADKPSPIWLVAAFVSYAFGLFGKESCVVAIALIPLFMHYFTNASLKQIGFVGGTLVLAFVVFYIARDNAIGWFLKAQDKDPSALDNVLALTKIDQTKKGGFQLHLFIPTVIYIMGYYVVQLFYPANLSCDYSYATVQVKGLGDWEFIVSALFYVAIVAYAIKTFKQKNIIGFGILWFIIASSIISNMFIVIGVSMGDRLMFMPSLGWAIAAVGLVHQLAGYAKKQFQNVSLTQSFSTYPILWGFTAIVASLFAFKAIERNSEWRRDYTLFASDIKKYPNSTHLMFYWGNHLTSNEYAEGKSADSVLMANKEAIETFKRSMSFYPALPSDGYNQYGKAYYNLYKSNPAVLNSYLDSARNFYLKAHVEDTTNPVFMNNLGTVYFERAVPMNRVDFYDSAFVYFYGAYTRDSSIIDYMNNIGALRGTIGDRMGAIQWLYKGYKSDSLSQGAVLSCKMIGGTYRDMGDSNNARAWYAKAAQVEQYRMQQLAARQ
jgi:protein O-mannosyl-transferase